MLEREIFCLIRGAYCSKDKPEYVDVENIYRYVHQVGTALVGSRYCFDLSLVLTVLAEAALHQNNYTIAFNAADYFMRDACIRNQLYCRILFVRGKCHYHRIAMQQRGLLHVRHTLEAIEYILQAVEFALTSDEYSFLIYNASVVYWHIARESMREFVWRFLIPSLTRISSALLQVHDKDILWIAKLQLSLAHALIDNSQFVQACQIVTEVIEKRIVLTAAVSKGQEDVAQLEKIALYEEAIRLSTFLNAVNDPECRKLTKQIRQNAENLSIAHVKKRMSDMIKILDVKSGTITEAEDSLIETFKSSCGWEAYYYQRETRQSVKHFLKSTSKSGKEKQMEDWMQYRTIAEIGIAALDANLVSVTMHCDTILQHASKRSKSDDVFLLHRLIQIRLELDHVLNLQTYNGPSSKAVPSTVKAIDRIQILEHILTLSHRIYSRYRSPLAVMPQRSDLCDCVERVCIYVWNQTQSLLEPENQSKLGRTFQLASDLLENMDSLLYSLRAMLYFELAKCNYSRNSQLEAKSMIQKALSLEYGVLLHAVNPLEKDISKGSYSFAELWNLHDQLQGTDKSPIFYRSYEPAMLLLQYKILNKERLIGREINPCTELHEAKVLALLEQSINVLSSGNRNSASLNIRLQKAQGMVRRAVKMMDMNPKTHDIPSAQFTELHLSLWNEILAVQYALASNYKCIKNILKRANKFCAELEASSITNGEMCQRLLSGKYRIHIEAVNLLSLYLDKCKESIAASGEDTRQSQQTAATLIPNDGFSYFVHNDSDVHEAKMEIIQHLSALSNICTQISWEDMIVSVGCLAWNTHVTAIADFLCSKEAQSSDLVSGFVSLLQAIFSLVHEKLHVPGSNSSKYWTTMVNLWLPLAVSLSLIHERSKDHEKALIICNKAFSASTLLLLTSAEYTFLDLITLVNIKSRLHLASIESLSSKNAKDKDVDRCTQTLLQSFQPEKLNSVALIQTIEYLHGSVSENFMDGLYQKLYSSLPTYNHDQQVIVAEVEPTVIQSIVWLRFAQYALRYLDQPKRALECVDSVFRSCARMPLLPAIDRIGVLVKKIEMKANVLAGQALVSLSSKYKKLYLQLIELALKKYIDAAILSVSTQSDPDMMSSTILFWNALCYCTDRKDSWDIVSPVVVAESLINSIMTLSRSFIDFRCTVVARIKDFLCVVPSKACVGKHNAIQSLRIKIAFVALEFAAADANWSLLSSTLADTDFVFKCLDSNLAKDNMADVATKLAYYISIASIHHAAMTVNANCTLHHEITTAFAKCAVAKDPLSRNELLRQLAMACDDVPVIQPQILLKALQIILTVVKTASLSASLDDCQVDKSYEKKIVQLSLTLADIGDYFYENEYPFPDIHRFYTLSTRLMQRVAPNGMQCEFGIRIMTKLGLAAAHGSDRRHYVSIALKNVLLTWQTIIEMVNNHHANAAEPTSDSHGDSVADKVAGKDTIPTGNPSGHPHDLQVSNGSAVESFVNLFRSFDVDRSHRFADKWKLLTQAFQMQSPSLSCYYLEKLYRICMTEDIEEYALPVISLYHYMAHFVYSTKPSDTTRNPVATSSSPNFTDSPSDLPIIIEIWVQILYCQSSFSPYLQESAEISRKTAIELVHCHSLTIYRDLLGQTSMYTSEINDSTNLSQIDLFEKAIEVAQHFLEMKQIQECKFLIEIICGLCRENEACQRRWSVRMVLLMCRYHMYEGNDVAAMTLMREGILNCDDREQSTLFVDFTEKSIVFALLLIRQEKYFEAYKHLENAETTVRKCISETKLQQRTLHSQAAVSVQALIDCTNQAYFQELSPLNRVSEGLQNDELSLSLLKQIVQLRFEKLKISFMSDPQHILNSNVSTLDPSSAMDMLSEGGAIMDECFSMLAAVEFKSFLIQIMEKYYAFLTKVMKIHGSRNDEISEFLNTSSKRTMSRMANLIQNLHLCNPDSDIVSQEAIKESPLANPNVYPRSWKLAMLELKQVECLLTEQLSYQSVREYDMQFHKVQKENSLSVVDKWLQQTSSDFVSKQTSGLKVICQIREGIAKLDAIKAVLDILKDKKLSIHASVLRLQCQRLQHSREIPSFLSTCWTNFTFSKSPQATWILGNSTFKSDKQDGEAFCETLNDEGSSEKLLTLIGELQHQLHLAYAERSHILVRQISYELLLCAGFHDVQNAIRYLCTYQSSVAVSQLKRIYCRFACPKPLQQQHLHDENFVHTLPYNFAAGENCQECCFPKQYCIKDDDFSASMAAMPSSQRVLALQFSPELCFLYGAYITPCSLSNVRSNDYNAIARVEIAERSELSGLQERLSKWREKHEQLELFNTQDSKLELEYQAIFSDILQFFHVLFHETCIASALTDDLPRNHLTLLLDRELAIFPLELFPQLQVASSVSRDFSISFIRNRQEALQKRPFQISSIYYQFDRRLYSPPNVWKPLLQPAPSETSSITLETEIACPILRDDDWKFAFRSYHEGGLVSISQHRVLGSSVSYKTLMECKESKCHLLILLDHVKPLTNEVEEMESLDTFSSAALYSLMGITTALLSSHMTFSTVHPQNVALLLKYLDEGMNVADAIKRCTMDLRMIVDEKVEDDTGTCELAADRGRDDTNAREKPVSYQYVEYIPVLYGIPFVVVSDTSNTSK